MSELRVNNIVSENGTSAPIYSQGMSIGAGKTLTCAGDFSVGGDVSFSSGATIAGIVTISEVNLNSNLNLVGVLTASSGNFGGNVTVGGTLTYEDVTNIDSVGIVTAQTGIKVLAGGINAVGVVTAASGLEVSAGTVYLSGKSKEKAHVTTTTIATSQTFDLNSGMVHFRNSGGPTGTTGPALLTYSPSNVNTFMATNDVITVTIICTGAAGAYFSGLSIDGSAQTVNWAGGAAPTDGSAGKDMYVFTIVKTAGSTFTVFGTQTKTA